MALEMQNAMKAYPVFFVHGALRSMNDSNAPFNSPNAILYEKTLSSRVLNTKATQGFVSAISMWTATIVDRTY